MVANIQGAFLLFGALWSLAFGTEAVSRYPVSYQVEAMAYHTDAKSISAMRYHGILHTWEEGGVWYFRNPKGQKCRLFTHAFETRWNRRGGGDE